MIKSHYIIFVIILLSVLTMTSCVKDVDFEQGEAFTFQQRNLVNLIHFDLDSQDFSSPALGGVVRDTTRLEFLGEGFVNENLHSIEFLFEYRNSFSQDFRNRIVFLNENNQEKYTINFDIEGSPNGSPVLTAHREPIPINETDSIRQSIKVVFELELQDNGQPIQGALNLQSAADFIVELGGESTGG